MSPTILTKTPSNIELELQFLRHLVYRSNYKNGKYLSEVDKIALQRLMDAHPQDCAYTSLEDLVVFENQRLNPQTSH